MKRVLMLAALAIFGVAPTIGGACEYNDAASASASPPAQLVSAPTPAATRVPTATPAKSVAPKAAKQVVEKVKTPAPDQTLAAATSN
jgi:hypothetical protein